MQLTKEEFIKKYKSLPEELKLLLSSDDTTETLIEIGKKYNLRVDQQGMLSDLVSLTVMGDILPNNLSKELTSSLSIDTTTAEQLALELDEKILKKARVAYVDEQKTQPDIPSTDSQPGIVTQEKPTPTINDPYREQIE